MSVVVVEFTRRVSWPRFTFLPGERWTLERSLGAYDAARAAGAQEFDFFAGCMCPLDALREVYRGASRVEAMRMEQTAPRCEVVAENAASQPARSMSTQKPGGAT